MRTVATIDCGDGIVRTAPSFHRQVVKTSAYTIKNSDYGRFFSNAGAGAGVTLTLPPPKPGFLLYFIRTAAFTITLQATSTAKINGSAAGGTLAISTTGLTMVVSDGTDWFALVS